MRRVPAILEGLRERRADRRRRGPRRQRRRREAERLVRISVLVFARWARRRGLSMAQAAVRLGLDPSTVGAWRAGWSTDHLRPRERGRPLEPVSPDQRWSILAVFGLMGPQVGLPTLQSLFPEVARSALVDLQRRCRDVFFRKAAWIVHTLRWTRAGAVWAMDFAVPPQPIEGLYTRLFVVRDLASGCVLVAIPALEESATLVIRVLESLFRWFGRPLVLKSDNGSPFIAEDVKDFLRREGVRALYSPEGTPEYNGSVEAGIGSIKVRAFWHAALDDRPGEWTCDDIEAAMRQANETGRPHGVGAPTPQESWLWRRPIGHTERKAFDETVSRFAREEYTQRGWLPMAQLQHREEASIDRVAISRALIELGLLLIRRRRITPPISILRRRKIS
jgi:transposase InsO family protein